MRRAFIFLGFNNWGKTTLICDLFARQRFEYGRGYRLNNQLDRLFTVESHSNDDTGQQRYIDMIERRVTSAPSNVHDLISVLCPSRDPNNDACSILSSHAFQPFNEIHLVLMRYKWDLHAQLCVEDIKAYFHQCGDKRLVMHVIDEGTSGDDGSRRIERTIQAHKVILKVVLAHKH